MGNLDATIVNADGTTQIEPHEVAQDPAIDCFYVYPTVSFDAGGNSDLIPGGEEIFTTLNQAARYNEVCRVFAPVYRQTTVPSIFDKSLTRDSELAYADVLDAFREYIAHHNAGRGYLLIGHSQGASHLRRLVDEVVEEEPTLAARFVAAHLIGSSPQIPVGADVGGSFDHTLVCRASDHTACVVSYASYREDDPFLLAGEGRFGRPNTDDSTEAICAAPGALVGGPFALRAYFPIDSNTSLDGVIIKRVSGGPFADPARKDSITTPFYTMPGFLTGQCVTDSEGINYLEVTVNADSADPRADDFNGEFIGGDGWGLHLVDMTIAMGNLVELALQQGAAWLGGQ